VRSKEGRSGRGVSAWRDLFVTGLWVVPAIAGLAYWVSAIVAIAVVAAVVVALAFLLDSAIEHTIQLDHTD
jgi:anti-sigma-K factor RskA